MRLNSKKNIKGTIDEVLINSMSNDFASLAQ